MKKILLVLFLFIFSACGQQEFGAGETAKTSIDKRKIQNEALKIKADYKEDILYSEISSYERNEKSYVYVSKVKAQKRKLSSSKKELLEKYGTDDKLGADTTTEIKLKEAIDQPDELLDKRTYNSVTYKIGTSTTDQPMYQSDFYSGAAFYYDSPDWFYVEYGTTTIEAWDLQMGLATGTSFWKEPIKSIYPFQILPAKAACGDSGGSCYVGAGDGCTADGASGSSWSTTRGNTTARFYTNYTVSQYWTATQKADATSWYIYRSFFPVDTSALADTGITITAASLYLYHFSVTDGEADAQGYLNIVGPTNQAANTQLVANDYDNCGGSSPTKWSSDKDLTGLGTGYLEYQFNSSGIAGISQTGYTLIGHLDGHDIENSAPDSGVSGAQTRYSETTGTSEDPYLTITYTAGAASAPLDGFKSSVIEF